MEMPTPSDALAPDQEEHVSSFRGIPNDAVEFLRELRVDNSKAWWELNKQRYAASVRDPLAHLLDGLADEFGEASLFRPYRDVRFSADKSPYKEHQGALIGTAGGMGWYLQIGPEGLMTGAGFYAQAPDQIARYRSAVDTPASGTQLDAIVTTLRENGIEIGGDQLKTKPRGFTADHPRLELLRHKSLTATRAHGVPDWMSTPAVLDHVRAEFASMRPLVGWLTANVGGTLAPTRGSRP